MTRWFDPADIPVMPDLRYESALWASGLARVAGLDEAGRGAWAGPVSAGAVILPSLPEITKQLNRVRDSKQMSPAERAFWAVEIRVRAFAWGVGMASNEEIDTLGIVPATRLAMRRAIQSISTFDPITHLCSAPQHLLIDALRLPDIDLPQTSLIKGDARSLSIAAASVLAKTARDALMVEFGQEYPRYGFARHKGYGTAAHQTALEQAGPCPIHRFSFAPLKQIKR